jgi:hypothetical protein
MKKLTAQPFDGSFPLEVKMEKNIFIRINRKVKKKRRSYCDIIQ